MIMFTSLSASQKINYLISNMMQAFAGRNEVLFIVGLALLCICVLCKFILPKKYRKEKKTKWVYRAAWIISILLILFSMMTGLGNGFGFGNGAGIGDGFGIWLGDDVVAASKSNILERQSQVVVDGKILIRVHNNEVFVGEVPCKDETELRNLLQENYKDKMTIILLDDYADNASYMWVHETLEDMAYVFQIERTD